MAGCDAGCSYGAHLLLCWLLATVLAGCRGERCGGCCSGCTPPHLGGGGRVVAAAVNSRDVAASPKRTLKTAELVFGKENNFIATELIKEAIVNPCDKRESKVESIKNFPFINFTNINDNYDYNKIESNSKIENRCDEFYNLIKNSHHKNIAVVTHGEYLNRFINKYSNQLNIQDKNWFKNCELRTGFIY